MAGDYTCCWLAGLGFSTRLIRSVLNDSCIYRYLEMATYEFTLRFNIENCQRNIDDILEELAEAGCTDAFISMGRPGRLAMAFSRESNSAVRAICSAVSDVDSVIPEAILIEVGSDL